MKKFLLAILVVVFVFSLTSCSQNTVKITDENFENYFDVEVLVQDVNETTTGSGIWTQYKDTCILTISISPKKSVIVEDQVGVEFLVGPSKWFESRKSSYFEKDSDGEYLTEYDDGGFKYIAKIELASDGTATVNLNCKYQGVTSYLDDLPDAEIYNIFGGGQITIK